MVCQAGPSRRSFQLVRPAGLSSWSVQLVRPAGLYTKLQCYKVAISYQKLPKVAQSCQKKCKELPRDAKSCQKLQSCKVAMLQCCIVAMLQSCNVAMLHWCNVVMLQISILSKFHNIGSNNASTFASTIASAE